MVTTANCKTVGIGKIRGHHASARMTRKQAIVAVKDRVEGSVRSVDCAVGICDRNVK